MPVNVRIIYVITILVCFGVGAYVWKIANTGRLMHASEPSSIPQSQTESTSVLVYVEGEAVTSDDLDFEYSLHTKGVFDSEALIPIPDLGSRYEKELAPLAESLLSAIIERKMLYNLVKRDESFDSDNPSRYSECIGDWQEAMKHTKNDQPVIPTRDSGRLKQRLCERSLILQYLEEKLFAGITVDEAESVAYYRDHKSDFEKPARVVIRQIVLASEREAKRARHGLNRYNFAQRARELSITPEAERGGVLGPFSRGQMPRVFDVAFTMRRGDIYGILKSTYGFHLIMLEKKMPKQSLGLEEALPQINQILKKKKQEQAYRDWIEHGLNTVHIKPPKQLW